MANHTRKPGVRSVLTPLLFPHTLTSRRRAIFLYMLYHSVIKSVWLFNWFILVEYLKRNAYIKNQVNFNPWTQYFASAITLNLCNVKGLYFIFKRWMDKRKSLIDLRVKIKGQPSCDLLDALYFWRNIFLLFDHRYFRICKKTKWKKMIRRRHSEHQRTKRSLVKVSNGCLPIELFVFVIFGELW